MTEPTQETDEERRHREEMLKVRAMLVNPPKTIEEQTLECLQKILAIAEDLQAYIKPPQMQLPTVMDVGAAMTEKAAEAQTKRRGKR